MSIWGTLIGGMLGFTIGGPIGALLGSFLGSKFSSGKVKSINFSNENSQQIFALALIILSAKIRCRSHGLWPGHFNSKIHS